MITRTLLVGIALSLPNPVCFAGEKEVLPTPVVPVQQNPNRDSLWYADTELSYTFGSKFRRESDFGSQPYQGMKLTLSSGYTFERKFDYYHRGPIFRSKGAPYVQLQVELTLPAEHGFSAF